MPSSPKAVAGFIDPSPLPRLDRGDFALTDTDTGNDAVIHDPDAILTNRAHRQFGLERRTEFSHQQYVKRGIECPGDFGRYRYTAAGQAEHQRLAVPKVFKSR
jgi:hypothetical protein